MRRQRRHVRGVAVGTAARRAELAPSMSGCVCGVEVVARPEIRELEETEGVKSEGEEAFP